MRRPPVLLLALAVFAFVRPAKANTISSCVTTVSGATSCTGSLETPEDIFLELFTVPGAGSQTITIQTFGFGGGTNAAGNAISAGGFDSLVALFSGPPETILTDGSGNPIASIPGSTQFFSGCPPAGMVSIGGTATCGDNKLTTKLSPGAYTLLLSDADYVPFAVSPGPPISSLLSDGFADLSGGVFQTCTTIGACLTRNGNFAVDISGVPLSTVPEPDTLVLLTSGLVLFVFARRRGNMSTRV
jgi:PEP-CTERM motif